MLNIESTINDAAFNFSIEQYIMRSENKKTPIAMLWQTGKTVMLGSYQVANIEVDLDFTQKNDIKIVRRSSGGGTIFTDSGTILLTLILPYDRQESSQFEAKKMLASWVIESLGKLGITAKQEGRNDITVFGKKVTGIAQYAVRNKICSHCSLLYDTDLEMLARVLKVDDEKIRSKAIRSIRSRVANVADYMKEQIPVAEIKKLMLATLGETHDLTHYSLPHEELAEIEKINEEKYSNPAYIFGRSPNFSYKNSKRFSGGRVDVYLDVARGVIESCSIRGDFMGTVPIRLLEEKLEKVEYQKDKVNDALAETSLDSFLGHVTKEEFLSCLFE
ncbi:MAG: lipoate--protein ligase [Oscillospiraceae bacterium]|nr:lipoate--protein ligase [Oscillospiraceae bacterium]MCL2279409.1 lipoate--protein ligase [Oscillospiraceae bacterium]